MRTGTRAGPSPQSGDGFYEVKLFGGAGFQPAQNKVQLMNGRKFKLSSYKTDAQRRAYYRTLKERLLAEPDIDQVAGPRFSWRTLGAILR